MNRKKIIMDLIATGRAYVGSGSTANKGEMKLIAWLAKSGFAERIPDYVLSTNATPLALLTPSCRQRAERLANGLQNRYCISLAECKFFDVLTDAGFAVANRSGYHPTEKLIAAVKCWREAKEGNR